MRSSIGVALGQQAPAPQRNPHGAKVAGADGHQAHVRCDARGSTGRPSGVDRGVPMQQPSSGNWFANATSSTPGIASSASTSRRWKGTRLSRHRRRWCPGTLRTKVRTSIGVEARRDAGEIPEVDDQDRAHRQQPEGERDFGDDERSRQAPAARAGRGPRAVAEHVGRRGPRRLPERREARQRARETRRAQREERAPSSPRAISSGARQIVRGHRHDGRASA